MMAVGVRELKAQLSRYLREVAAGETVLVTDRGRVIAELRAPGETPHQNESELDRRLREMARHYPITIGRRREGYHYPARPLGISVPAGTVKALLDWDRDDSGRLR